MLAKPFRSMARGRLLLLLLLLIILELVGAAGLYANNRQASAQASVPGTTITNPAIPLAGIGASPALILAGHSTIFSARIPDLANKKVSYEVHYADGVVQQGTAVADVSGFSDYAFLVRSISKTGQETVTVVLKDGNLLRASTTFTVYVPIAH